MEWNCGEKIRKGTEEEEDEAWREITDNNLTRMEEEENRRDTKRLSL